jgi:ABC-type multidrug transport system fused ATPase/permease subunit
MDISYEPLSIITLILVQIGGRFLKFDLTHVQQKLINHPVVQAIILLAMIFFATKNLLVSVLIVLVVFLFLYILLNENHKYNLLPRKWLSEESEIIDTSVKSIKEIYKENIKKMTNI